MSRARVHVVWRLLIIKLNTVWSFATPGGPRTSLQLVSRRLAPYWKHNRVLRSVDFLRSEIPNTIWTYGRVSIDIWEFFPVFLHARNRKRYFINISLVFYSIEKTALFFFFFFPIIFNTGIYSGFDLFMTSDAEESKHARYRSISIQFCPRKLSRSNCLVFFFVSLHLQIIEFFLVYEWNIFNANVTNC